MREQGFAQGTDCVGRHRAAELDPEDFGADPPAEPADIRVLHLRFPALQATLHQSAARDPHLIF
jgi:hypothetical protein